MEYKFSEKIANMKPSAIREIFKSLADPEIIAFAAGNPAPESFPVEAFERLSADILRETPVTALQYGITEGHTPLREAVAARIHDKFGVGRDFDTTIITTGGQQGIDLCCKVMCDPGDVVICEKPTFIGALNAFRANGAIPVGVDLGPDGMDPNRLEAALNANPRAKLIYTIPTFHNPMGVCTSFKRRIDMYAIAKRHGVLILEDNPYGELRFRGEDIAAIKSFDDDGVVMYCSSFSKILSAGMRVGFLCGPAPVIQKIVVAKQVNDVHTNMFFQMLCERYIKNYNLDAHIEGIRALYRRRAGVMAAAYDACVPDWAPRTDPEGGLFLWSALPEGTDIQALVAALLERKVAVVTGAAFMPDENEPSWGIRLNYSTPTDEQIGRGIEILGEEIKKAAKG